MVDNDFACNGSWASYAYENLCKHNANWAKQKFCQRSCFANGAGYDGDECCDEQTHITTPSPMPSARPPPTTPTCATLDKKRCKKEACARPARRQCATPLEQRKKRKCKRQCSKSKR